MSKLRDGVIKRGSTRAYVIRVPDPETGRSRPKWVGGFATEQAAKAARDEARVAARRGEYVDRSALTVREYLTEWLETHEASVKRGSIAGYRADVERYIIPRIGGPRLQSLRPAARAKLPRAPRGEPGIVWTAGQLAAFLQHAASHRLFPFFRLAAYTGARRSELPALEWAALDLDAAEVTLRGPTDVIDGSGWTTRRSPGAPASSHSMRAPSRCCASRRRQLEARMKAGPAWHETGPVFTAADGQPIFPDTVSLLMGKLIRDYNAPAIPGRGRGRPHVPLPPPDVPLPRMRLHDLRHVHATTPLLASVPVHVMANRLDHADPSTTLRVYAHVLREQAAGAAEVFAEAVEAAVSRGVSR
ncbi:MAG TPA: tyrosine-type recombinase/integrase [Actinomycetes bacterium]|jgi:integrase|nr:tyrosine-type recombinase/integrase [Actinomycetes bacterium]